MSKWLERHTRGFALCCLVVFLNTTGNLYAQDPPFEPAPDEIEQSQRRDITQAQEEADESAEKTLFDLYIGQRYSGVILAGFTDDWFEIDNPADVIEQAQEQLDAGYQEIEDLSRGKIFGSRSVEGVGSISYNLNTFRIILEPEAKFLSSTNLASLGQVPDPEKKLSFRQDFGVSSSGEVSEDFQSALAHRSVLGFGKYLAQVEGAYIDDEDYELDRATAGGIIGDYSLDVGLLRSQGLNFASGQEFLGASLSTEEELFLDQNQIRGSRVEVFIPSRSQVEYFRGNRLLGVEILDYGLQEINTSQFPQGSYDLDIVITENNGNVIRERQFFTKSGFLAARGIPIIYIQAGVLRDQLALRDTPLYQTGIRVRALDFLQVEPSIYGSDQDTVGELSLVSVYRDNVLRISAVYDDEGASGLSTNISGTLPISDIRFNGSIQRTFNVDQQNLTPSELESGRISQAFNEQNSIGILNEISGYSASVSKVLGKFELRYKANRNERTVDPSPTPPPSPLNPILPPVAPQSLVTARYIYGPELVWNVLQTGKSDLRLVTSYFSTDSGGEFVSYLNYRYNFGGNLNYLSLLRNRSNSGQNERLLSNSVQYNSRNINEKGTFAEVTNEVQYFESPNKDTFTTNSARVEHTADIFRTNLFVRDKQLSDEDSTSVGFNLSSSFIFSGDKLSLSYPVRRESVFIADIESNTTKTPFDVLVNNSVYDTIPAGSSAVLGLYPYRTYEVTVRPTEEGDLVSFDQEIYKITLFPGNIARRTWRIERVVIATGRLVNEAGKPIEFERIRGTLEYTITEKGGSFQAEVAGGEELTVQSHGHDCSFMLPVPEDADYFVDFGDVICRSLNAK